MRKDDLLASARDAERALRLMDRALTFGGPDIVTIRYLLMRSLSHLDKGGEDGGIKVSGVRDLS